MTNLNFTQAKQRALEEPTLLDALTYICIWESERVVKQARANVQWETCFGICLEGVMTEWNNREKEKEIDWDNFEKGLNEVIKSWQKKENFN